VAVGDRARVGERDRVLVLDPLAAGLDAAVRARFQSGRITGMHALACG
jgi:hypothetical protein